MSKEPVDDLDLFRRELFEIGFSQASAPEDFGLEFRSAESFFESAASPQLPSHSRPKWIRSLGAIATVAAAGVLAVTLAVQTDGRPGPQGPPPVTVSPEIMTVASVLRQAAEASALLPDQSDARFWMVESIQQQGPSPAESRKVWLGNGVPGLLVDDYGRVKLPPATFGLQRTTLSWGELVALPTEPAVLRDLLDTESVGLISPRLQVAKMAAHLLAESPAPPPLRQALWHVIAGIPGITSPGVVKDALGREGVGLALRTPNSGSVEYVIDPDRGRLLQFTTMSGRPGADSFRATYLDQRPAGQLPPR